MKRIILHYYYYYFTTTIIMLMMMIMMSMSTAVITSDVTMAAVNHGNEASKPSPKGSTRVEAELLDGANLLDDDDDEEEEEEGASVENSSKDSQDFNEWNVDDGGDVQGDESGVDGEEEDVCDDGNDVCASLEDQGVDGEAVFIDDVSSMDDFDDAGVGVVPSHYSNENDEVMQESYKSFQGKESEKRNEEVKVKEKQQKSEILVNYAHKNSGAIILSSSKAIEGASNILVSDRDKYAIAPCDALPSGDKNGNNSNLWIIIALPEDILMKSISLANYEQYSSSIKTFRVLGSTQIPTKESDEDDDDDGNSIWSDLGTYNTTTDTNMIKAVQTEEIFDLKVPSWARYIKLVFLSHYGVEFYCTVSQVKVHGSTMVQGFHEEYMKDIKEIVDGISRGVNNDDDSNSSNASSATEKEIEIQDSAKDSEDQNVQNINSFGKIDSEAKNVVNGSNSSNASIPEDHELPTLEENTAVNDESNDTSLHEDEGQQQNDESNDTNSAIPEVSSDSTPKNDMNNNDLMKSQNVSQDPNNETNQHLENINDSTAVKSDFVTENVGEKDNASDITVHESLHQNNSNIELKSKEETAQQNETSEGSDTGHVIKKSSEGYDEVDPKTTNSSASNVESINSSSTDGINKNKGDDAPNILTTAIDQMKNSAGSQKTFERVNTSIRNKKYSACLDNLEYAVFMDSMQKKAMQKQKQTDSKAEVTTSSSSFPMETIFKTLSNDIKSMIVNQTILDQCLVQPYCIYIQIKKISIEQNN